MVRGGEVYLLYSSYVRSLVQTDLLLHTHDDALIGEANKEVRKTKEIER